jgi:hypothetical protein
MPTTDDTPAREFGEVKVIKDQPPPKPEDQGVQPPAKPKQPEPTADDISSAG